MCEVLAVGAGGVAVTPSGIPYYLNNSAGDAAMNRDMAASMGPGAGEPDHEESDAPPPEDCSEYNSSMWDTNASPNFKYANMKRVPQGGSVDEKTVACNWQKLCQNILEPVKAQFPGMTISSGFRPSSFDRSVGGSGGGDHTYGRAADIQLLGPGAEAGAKQLFKFIGSSGLPFSQLIYEGRWVHVAYGGGTAASAAVLVTRTGTAPYQNGGGRSGAALPADLRWA